MEEEALGAIAMRWLKRLPVPSASGASPLSTPSSLLAASSFPLTPAKIVLLRPTAIDDSHGMFFLCSSACQPNAPIPILLSRIAEYFARLISFGALSMKY